MRLSRTPCGKAPGLFRSLLGLPEAGLVDARFDQPVGKIGAGEDVVDAQTGITLPPVSRIVPEWVDGGICMDLAQAIRPSLLDQARVRRAARRLQQCVLIP